MGYLQIPVSALPNFSKAVISFWFRIPTATFTAMSAVPYPVDPGFLSDTDQRDTVCSAYYSPPIYKIIPLITFGSVETDYLGNQVQPSFIGVDCIVDGLNALCCNLQTPVTGGLSGDSTAAAPRPGCFYMSGWTFGPGTATNAYVAPDVWHHALISFDISGSESFTADAADPGPPDVHYSGTSTFSWALDDVSKVGLSMSPSGGGATPGLATNVIVSGAILDVSGDTSVTPLVASFSGGHIASAANPIGIPMSSSYVSNGQKVELAELQIFTGVTTDASIEGNRRAFIGADGSPANMSLAEALLGQAPNIKLHGSNNWKTGANTGSLGTTFEATGTITTYTTAPDITP